MSETLQRSSTHIRHTHVHILANVKVARVLLDTLGRLADAGALDIVHPGPGEAMLEDGVVDAVALFVVEAVLLGC